MNIDELKEAIKNSDLYIKDTKYHVHICSNKRAGAIMGKISKAMIGNYGIYGLIDYDAAVAIIKYAYTDLDQR